MPRSPPVVAVFDLDGTLTRRDTVLPFARFAVGSARLLARLPRMIPALTSDNTALKQRLVDRVLHDVDLDAVGERFAATRIDPLLRPEALARLRWHRERGHPTALVSASFEAYVAPFGRRHGFDLSLGTRVRDGRVENCYGPAKLLRLREHWTDVAMHVYGDSDGDRPLLDAADWGWYRTFPVEDP